MDTVPQFVVAGIPLIVLVFALVEEIKSWGLTGKILKAVSLVLGVLFAVAYQLSFFGVPAVASEWFTVVVVGLLYGLAASGGYNFLDSRFPPK